MRAKLGLFVLLTGCNLVFGLEEASEREPQGAGGVGAGGSGGVGGSGADTTTSGGTGGVGGTGGTGGNPCPQEEPAGPGTERLANGSFEDGEFGWLASGLTFQAVSTESFCGCQSARVVLGDGYAELRGLLPAPEAGTYFARARLQTPDLVDASLVVRIDNIELQPPINFGLDADDDEGPDGWRVAEGSWPVTAATDALLVIAFDGASAPPDTEVSVDCVSLTFEP